MGIRWSAGAKVLRRGTSEFVEGVGGAIGKTTDEIIDGHKLMGNRISMPS